MARHEDNLTFREIVEDAARVTHRSSADSYIQDLLSLYLRGRFCDGGRSMVMWRNDQPSDLLTNREEFPREAFYGMSHWEPWMPREVRDAPQTPPEDGSRIWDLMAKVALRRCPTRFREQTVECFAISRVDLREAARRHGPDWLIEWLQTGDRNDQTLQSAIPVCRAWLKQEVAEAKRDGKKLKKKETRGAARKSFSRLTYREFDQVWAEVPDEMKYSHRPPSGGVKRGSSGSAKKLRKKASRR